jgi:hypothetical protein
MLKKIIILLLGFTILDGLGFLALRLSNILILDGIDGGYISTGDYLPSIGNQNTRSKIIEASFAPFIFTENRIRAIEYRMNEKKYLDEDGKQLPN